MASYRIKQANTAIDKMSREQGFPVRVNQRMKAFI
jgi:hypothetical protein